MTIQQIDPSEEDILYPELSDEADKFYLGDRVDLENCSPHGYYCRVKLPKQHETRTFRLDLGKLESFNLL